MIQLPETIWKNKSVLITGHTGFKGGWLTTWLATLGAKIHGYALSPATQPNLFETARISSLLTSDTRADISDILQLKKTLLETQPSVIFHLAAQPLVRESYLQPIETLQTNILGTACLLEAARGIDSIRAIVVITTDKVYANREDNHAFSENDALGGFDIYSASKACAEIVTSSYRNCFFQSHSALIATARAGNVIGGGDWAVDRLIPDCLRAFALGNPVQLRYPNATRPWQHVLESISGYLRLAECLLSTNGKQYARAWNFGPDQQNDATVMHVAKRLADLWSENTSVIIDEHAKHPHEAVYLKLNSCDARTYLGWKSQWNLEHTLQKTIEWHQAWICEKDMQAVSRDQLLNYTVSHHAV